jgi:serine/threonine protein kinase/CubicO group peptidase (beta-lactamase class C family)
VAAGTQRRRSAPGSQGGQTLGSLGPYRLLEELGRGSFGVVYEADKPGSPQRYAIKVLKDESDWEGVQRFRLEVIVGRKLHHPGIVNVIDAGRDRGVAYAVMPFVEGELLARRVRQSLPPREAARVVANLARAIAHAHDLGVVHRDLKPSNVIMDAKSDAPRITDLGLAKDHAEMRLTRTGDGMGTPAYMAPEQFRGAKHVDARADVYSLGVILYECLTGMRPYSASTFVETMELARRGLCRPPRTVRPAVPPELEAICLRAMAVEADDRPASAGELAAALDDWLAAESEVGEEASAKGLSPSVLVSGGVALIGLLAAAGIVLTRGVGRPGLPDELPVASSASQVADVAPAPTPPVWPAGPSRSNEPAPVPHHDGELIEGPGWALAAGLSKAELEAQVAALRERGSRPAVLHANSEGGEPRFLAVWTEDTESWELELDLPEEGLKAASDQRRREGLSVACLAYYTSSVGNRLAVVWARMPQGRSASAGLTTQIYQSQFNQSNSMNLQAVWHAGLGAGQDRRLALVWSMGRGAPGFSVHDRQEGNFLGALLGAQALGFVPHCATRYGDAQQRFFGGLWQRESREATVVHDVPADEHRALVASFREVGFRPLFAMENGAEEPRYTSTWVRERERGWTVTGAEAPGAEALDAIVHDVMTGCGVTRGALAVARGGRLALARGYAHVPDGVDPTDAHARFRLGALSVPLTAVGALRLVEAGQLDLSSPLGDHLSAFRRWAVPTVRDLLSHRSGWPTLAELAGERGYRVKVFSSMILDNEEEPDFLFKRRVPLGPSGLESILADRPPRPLPPDEWYESDLGYALLARIVGSVSRVGYADWISQQVLAPLGIEGIAPARSQPSGRVPGEVVAESPRICRDVLGSGALLPRAYGARDLETFAGYAGWVGSAPDLARFAAALANPDQSPLLSRETIVDMWTPGTGEAGFGLGWSVEGAPADPLAWAESRLPGASGHLERSPGGTVWVLLLNREAPLADTVARIRAALAR